MFDENLFNIEINFDFNYHLHFNPAFIFPLMPFDLILGI
jgi:hypothetical protein